MQKIMRAIACFACIAYAREQQTPEEILAMNLLAMSPVAAPHIRKHMDTRPSFSPQMGRASNLVMQEEEEDEGPQDTEYDKPEGGLDDLGTLTNDLLEALRDSKTQVVQQSTYEDRPLSEEFLNMFEETVDEYSGVKRYNMKPEKFDELLEDESITIENPPGSRYHSQEAVAAAARKYRLHDKDTGSVEAQIAMMTEKLNYMAIHMSKNKRDLHSLRGYQGMFNRRFKHLKYLYKKDYKKFLTMTKELDIDIYEITKPKLWGARARREEAKDKEERDAITAMIRYEEKMKEEAEAAMAAAKAA